MFIDRKRITIVMIFIAAAAFAPRAMGQQVGPPQTPAVIKFDGDMAAFLAQIGEPYGATIGLEVDPQQPQSQVKFYLRYPTLADVLNAIVESAPLYRWRESGGFVEVVPQAGGSSLLDTRITYFQVNDLTREEALTQLINLPELQNRMRAANLNFRDAPGASTESGKQKVTLSFEGVTMRQAISMIVKASGGRFWIFRRYSDRSFSISNSPMSRQ